MLDHVEGVTDFERMYRSEWHKFEKEIPGHWTDGRFYQNGIEVELFQMDQTLHYWRESRGQECFGGCRQCKTKRLREEKEARRLELYGDEQLGEYPCDECDAFFNLKSKLEKHRENAHAAVQSVKCPKCGRLFQGQRAISHRARHLQAGCKGFDKEN